MKEYFSAIELLKGYVKKSVYAHQAETTCLCVKTISAIANYLRGKTGKAFSDMEEAYSAIKDILMKKSEEKYSTGIEFGFRARVIENEKTKPTKEKMFHIPFEKRHLVSPNRYSIHGIPSLYLGSSIYDCYIELGKPKLKDFYVSLYSFIPMMDTKSDGERIRLIDLSISGIHETALITNFVRKKEQEYMHSLDKLVMDILLWPLIKICSMECKYPDAPFKQEYIVPQLIYQLCSQNDEFVGIKYLSTKKRTVNEKIYDTFMMNYALPAHRIGRTGYCNKLAAEVYFSEAINYYEDNLDLTIIPEFAYTHRTKNGLPIISSLCEELEKDENIVSMDKMTLYIDALLQRFMNEEDVTLFSPLAGWASE